MRKFFYKNKKKNIINKLIRFLKCNCDFCLEYFKDSSNVLKKIYKSHL
jgi:hypothetical protein